VDTAALFEQLYPFIGKEYSLYKKGLPDQVVDSINSLCILFEAGSDDVRTGITSRADRKTSYLFLRFSDKAVLDAMRQNSEERVMRGLQALAIENCAADWRDSIFGAAALWHSALKIGADAERLFTSIASIALEPAKTRLFLSFLRRSPENRELAKFGLKEAIGPDGSIVITTR
jgi:hypothetical protein